MIEGCKTYIYCAGYPIEVPSSVTVGRPPPPGVSKNNRIGMMRYRLWGAQKGLCCYCNEYVEWEDSSVEHVIPKSKGGSNKKENLKMACKRCNGKRGNGPVEALLAILANS